MGFAIVYVLQNRVAAQTRAYNEALMTRYATVCSGIGSPELAIQQEGLDWSCSFMSEIEAFPRAVLKHHFASHPLHGDFTTIEKDHYEPVDVLIGGTPCQSFSVAGKRLGLDDARGNLSLEYLALARRLGTRWLVWENVPGILSSFSDDEEGLPSGMDAEGRDNWRGFTIRQRNDFAAFLSFLGECGYGYAWRVLDGQYFGVPQRRRRIVLVGYLGNWRPPAAVLFERESLRRDLTPSREKGKDVAPTIRSGAPNGGRGHGARSGDSKDELIVACSGGFPVLKMPRNEQRYMVSNVRVVRRKSNGQAAHLVPETTGTICADTHPGAYSGQDAYQDKLIPTYVATLGHTQGNGLGVSETETANTLEAITGSNQAVAHSPQMRVRRLTPTECERLMGFPDGYTDITFRKKLAADSNRYKALGNSMIVPKMQWILSRLDKVEKIMEGLR
jgi:DNA (cytosine-5)-methyltransferase 1